MGYWTKVLKRVFLVLFSIVGIYLAFKLAMFYVPFLVAFIIAIMIEPLIRYFAKKTKLTRKVSAIIVLILVSAIIVGLLAWGIISIISESTNLLQGLNGYFEKAYSQIQSLIASIDFSKIKVSDEISGILQSSSKELLNSISIWLKTFLTSVLQGLTSLPAIVICIGITLLATYFICTDRLYILDQIEHHFPSTWVKRFSMHLRELITTLGGYLKAEFILVAIAFVQVLIGLYIMKFAGLNIGYPLLAALAIGFVDALPILGSRKRHGTMGCYICN